MRPRRLIQTGFMAGELDPHIDGRIDTDHYAFGLSECENWVAVPEGPLVKRQGFEFVRAAAPTASWLTAFRRSVAQEYVLEWSDAKLRFFTNDARIETAPGVAYEIAVPYTAAEAALVCQQQSYDRLYCDHPLHAPGAVRRDTPLTFAFETTVLENGPFADVNTDVAATVTATGTLGAIALLASQAVFAAGHVGAQFRLEAKDFAEIKQWEPGMKNVATGDIVRNEGKVYTAASSGTTGSKAPIHSEGSYWDGLTEKDLLNDKGPYGVKWTYRHDRFGIVRITGFIDEFAVDAAVVRRLPDSLMTVASEKWAHSVFSNAEGWPSLVTLYKGRILHFKDADIVGSVVGDYGGGRCNFAAYSDTGTIEADLGFRRTIGTADEPLWVSADSKKVLLGTASNEIAVGPFNAGAAFSGTNIEAEPQSFYGSEAVFPVKTGTETIFVERGARRIRSADYDFGRDRYDAPDLNATSRHITAPGVVQLAFQRIPYNLVYGVREDGQLIVHPRTRDPIKGWSRFRLGGGARALSAVAAVGADGKRDALWILTERDTPAGTVREIWRQAYWRELGTATPESFYVDGGVRIAATAGDGSFTGLSHLAGQEVVALANGVVVKGLTVAGDGTLSLPAEVVPNFDYVAIVGLPYTARAVTMRPEIRDGQGTMAGLLQRVVKAVLRVVETLGLKVGAPGQPTPEEIVLRRGGEAMDEQVPLYSGDSDGLVDAEFDREGRMVWISEDPLPATITLAALNIDVSATDA